MQAANVTVSKIKEISDGLAAVAQGAGTAATGNGTTTKSPPPPAQNSTPAESIIQSKKLSILEIRAVFGSVVIQEAGAWNAVKGAAGKAAGAIATAGHNLTTKVTADKLQSAWKKAGSPTDSGAVKQIITGAGVDAGIVDKVYTELQIPTDATQSAPTDATQSAPTDATQSAPTNSQPSSTGGTTTQTSTGLVHTANPNNPNQPPPTTPTQAVAQPTPAGTQPQPGTSTMSKVGNFIKGIPAAVTGAAGSAVGGFVGGMKRGYQDQATENIDQRLSVTNGKLQFESKFLGKKI
jgi:hypothetical protein